MTWNIVSDSSCDLPMNSFTSDRVHFEIVPLRIQVGSREFEEFAGKNYPGFRVVQAEKVEPNTEYCWSGGIYLLLRRIEA
mgnify:CR=1 FL=1